MQTQLADFIKDTPEGREAEEILRACVRSYGDSDGPNREHHNHAPKCLLHFDLPRATGCSVRAAGCALVPETSPMHPS